MTLVRPTQSQLFDDSGINERARLSDSWSATAEDVDLVREIDGCPVGSNATLIALSHPPTYTAFPNPWLHDWIAGGQDESSDQTKFEPYAADVAHGKNDPYYATFNYHTKVPPLAIAEYILHYTHPGEIVADYFCGSGMAGLAAQLCGAWPAGEPRPEGSKLGHRKAVLVDISPVATFLAYAFTRSINGRELRNEGERIAADAQAEMAWLYAAPEGATTDYVVWSDVLICPTCTREFLYYEAAVDPETLEDRPKLLCPHCGATTTIQEADKARETTLDPLVGHITTRVKERPVVIYARKAGTRAALGPSALDQSVTQRAMREAASYKIPIASMPKGVNTRQARESHGIEYVHQFYTWRNLVALGWLHQRIERSPEHLRPFLTVILLALHARASKRNRHIPKYGHRHVGVLSGTLYVPPLREETNQFAAFGQRVRKAASSIGLRQLPDTCRISTQSATDLSNIPDAGIDYIFIDPPFGANLMYSELNFLWEAWLRAYTNASDEAIINDVQGKGLVEYQSLMQAAFLECFRTLKPGRWMTIEFHNSRNSVWVAIQEALQAAGFVVADVRTLDKKKGTIKQLSSANSVKQDLIISAYRPTRQLEQRFEIEAGTPEGAWDFIRSHLRQLPVFVQTKDGIAEVIVERLNYLLFDRVVAFHVQRGITVPLSAGELYAGLDQRFAQRDGMYFLTEQVSEYDRKRLLVDKVQQIELFVMDEHSAIEWLRWQLRVKPQTFQDVHPHFMREIGGWRKHERPLDLSVILAENFFQYDGKGDVPSQIHSYLSGNYHDLRNLAKDDPRLQREAKDRWYVPDPNKAQDLEKLRERELLREFEEYRMSRERQLKVFRLEAVRAGFKRAWQEHDYSTIVQTAGKIPETILQEDPKLLMWYDQALLRSGAEE